MLEGVLWFCRPIGGNHCFVKTVQTLNWMKTTIGIIYQN